MAPLTAPPPSPRPSRERRPPPAGSLAESLNYAVEGVIYVLRTQRNMRIELGLSFLALVGGLVFGVTRGELLAILLVGALVIVAEMINTAFEATIDIATSSFDPRAKVAKDVAAGAVLVCAVVALGVAYLVFADRLAHPTSVAIARVRTSPVHLTVIATALVLIAVIAGKALIGRGTPARGGLPSGHAAIAFSSFTAVTFISADMRHNVLVTVLAFVMASLAAHSRVESGIHTFPEVLAGAVLGCVVTVIVFQLWY
jgi:diacylglycerol kinase (ATP)